MSTVFIVFIAFLPTGTKGLGCLECIPQYSPDIAGYEQR